MAVGSVTASWESEDSSTCQPSCFILSHRHWAVSTWLQDEGWWKGLCISKKSFVTIRIQACSIARLIFNLPPRIPTTSSLIELHWLPLTARTEFKICLITFKAQKFNQPSSIRELLSFSSHESTPGLRSADDPYRLHEPRAIRERGFANRSFTLPRIYIINCQLQLNWLTP